jgi:alpha-1,3-rhamnosyl/mannosyltransferase
MARSLRSTLRFFGHVARDLAGTFRTRWQRFHRRLAEGSGELVVGVDVFPFTEAKTGVGWYEWSLLEALDRRDDGLVFNLDAHTFLAPQDPQAPDTAAASSGCRPPFARRPGCRSPDAGRAARRGRAGARVLDGNVLWAPNFFMPGRQLPFGRALVATFHDLAFSAMPETVAPETLRLLRTNLPTTLFRADRLIAVSDATAGELVERLAANRRRIHTIHEGLDPAFARAQPPATSDPALPASYLLFVSTLEPRKNVGGALEAFELVAQSGYHGHLVWCQITDYPPRLELSPVRDRIVHLDGVERSDLPALPRRRRAVSVVSRASPLLEAAARGTPVVTPAGRRWLRPPGRRRSRRPGRSPTSRRGRSPTRAPRTTGPARPQRAARFWDRAAATSTASSRRAAVAATDDEYRV